MKHVVVVGNGMVGARFAEELATRDAAGEYRITVLGEEEHEPYNRVLLSDFVAGRVAAGGLRLPLPAAERLAVLRGACATSVDRGRQEVTTALGTRHRYDLLVFATGARARVLPLPGLDPAGGLPGVHVLRSLDDARGIVAATINARRAIVIGGGVLGLEAAAGLARRGLAVTVVHAGTAIMDRQLPQEASESTLAMLRAAGICCELQAFSAAVEVDNGRASGLRLQDGRVLPGEMIVMACGTLPETRLAEASGLPCDGGIVVGDDLASPADRNVYAIGDCAAPPQGGTGLIAQGWEQARRLAVRLVHGAADQQDADSPTDVVRVKGTGLDIVAMGSPGPDDRRLRLSDPQAPRYVEVAVREGRVTAAVCIGAGAVAADLTAAYTRRTPVPADPAALMLRQRAGAAATTGSPTTMPERFTVCRCNGVTKKDLMGAWAKGARTRAEAAAQTRATTGCGGCGDVVDGILDWLRAADPDPRPSQPGSPGREPELMTAKHSSHGPETAAG
jgi:assimilatory nitrate reductase electron transfer subunit